MTELPLCAVPCDDERVPRTAGEATGVQATTALVNTTMVQEQADTSDVTNILEREEASGVFSWIPRSVTRFGENS